MKNLFAIVTFTAVIFSSSSSFSSEEIVLTEIEELTQISNDEFLGCFERRRECTHEATHRGYHHSTTLKDHHICPDHHVPFACYGNN